MSPKASSILKQNPSKFRNSRRNLKGFTTEKKDFIFSNEENHMQNRFENLPEKAFTPSLSTLQSIKQRFNGRKNKACAFTSKNKPKKRRPESMGVIQHALTSPFTALNSSKSPLNLKFPSKICYKQFKFMDHKFHYRPNRREKVNADV